MRSSTEVMVVHDPETDRYAGLDVIPWWRQEVVSAASVMVVGAGALGNEVLKNLALMGIGGLLIVDFDVIEDANLARSVLFRQGDRGRNKAEVAAERIAELNPDVTVRVLDADVGTDVGLGVFARIAVVLGCVDNRRARLSINRACWQVGAPWVDGAMEDLNGVARVFWPGRGACYECTLTRIDWQILEQRFSCPWLARRDLAAGKVPTTATMASIIGALQVQETMKILHSMPVTAGMGLVFNGRTNELFATEYRPKADCQSHWAIEHITELTGMATATTPVREVLAAVRKAAGKDAYIELREDVVIGLVCRGCGRQTERLHSIAALESRDLVCPDCSAPRRPVTTHRLTGDERYSDRSLAELGVPALDVLTVRDGSGYRHFEFTSDAMLVLGDLAPFCSRNIPETTNRQEVEDGRIR